MLNFRTIYGIVSMNLDWVSKNNQDVGRYISMYFSGNNKNHV